MSSYKKVKTVLVYGKKKCIYMKPKGTREYVKSKGEYVLLPVYVKRVAKIAAKKLIKNKNGKKKLRGGEHKSKTVKSKTVKSLQVRDVNDKKVLDLCEITDLNTELVLLSKEFIDNETIYSEKDRCKLQTKDVNGSIKFNINGVKKILFDYKPPFEKLYIYDSTGYKEIDVPDYLQTRNLHYFPVGLENPFTHTRIAFPTPSHHSNRVTADIVDNDLEKSKRSRWSRFVKRESQTTSTNDPLQKHYDINTNYIKSLKKKNPLLSKIKDFLSQTLTQKKVTTQGPSLSNRSGGGTRKSSPLKKNKGKKIINKHMFPNI